MPTIFANPASFLWSLASLGFPSRNPPKPGRQSGQVCRFLTSVCEVRMSVQYFASSSTSSFRFRDDLTNRAFGLSANEEQDRDCLDQCSMAIAQYHFARGVTPGLRSTCGARADNRSRQSNKPSCSIRKSAGY